jgi:hypothetical protein
MMPILRLLSPNRSSSSSSSSRTMGTRHCGRSCRVWTRWIAHCSASSYSSLGILSRMETMRSCVPLGERFWVPTAASHANSSATAADSAGISSVPQRQRQMRKQFWRALLRRRLRAAAARCCSGANSRSWRQRRTTWGDQRMRRPVHRQPQRQTPHEAVAQRSRTRLLARHARCAALALFPLPLICPYSTEKSLCGTGANCGAAKRK